MSSAIEIKISFKEGFPASTLVAAFKPLHQCGKFVCFSHWTSKIISIQFIPRYITELFQDLK